MILPDSIRISKRFLRSTGLRRIPCDLQLQNSQPNLMACLLIHFAGGTVTIDPPGRSNELSRILARQVLHGPHGRCITNPLRFHGRFSRRQLAFMHPR